MPFLFFVAFVVVSQEEKYHQTEMKRKDSTKIQVQKSGENKKQIDVDMLICQK